MKRILFIMCILVGINIYGQKKKTTQKYTKSYTTTEALSYVEDHFSFYEADTNYDNPQVRKISNNVFHVRVDVCWAGENCYTKDFTYGFLKKYNTLWHSELYILTIGTGGRYRMEKKFN